MGEVTGDLMVEGLGALVKDFGFYLESDERTLEGGKQDVAFDL